MIQIRLAKRDTFDDDSKYLVFFFTSVRARDRFCDYYTATITDGTKNRSQSATFIDVSRLLK